MGENKLYPEGLLGKKLGMTQIFDENGRALPVTVVEIGPCYIVDLKEEERHGYVAVQLGFQPKKAQRVTRPMMGHFRRAERGAFYHVREVRCDAKALGWTALGQELQVQDVFEAGDVVDVSGRSIGRGFSGVVRRYRVKGQPATRGTHEVRRNIGSIGNCKSPGRVTKNRKMPGHHGNVRRTVQNLKVVAIEPERNLLLIKGAVPGAKGSIVLVRKAVKSYVAVEARVSGKAAA